MKLKSEWNQWLHGHKRREIEAAFSPFSDMRFGLGLELGAGDGYQSELLTRYVERIISTEINPNALRQSRTTDRVEYRVCSAEEALKMFPDRTFDLVFSSNLLEHVNDPAALLSGVNRLLKDDGITIHIVPSPFWKLCHLLWYIPAHYIVLIERLTRTPGMFNFAKEAFWVIREFFQGIFTGSNPTFEAAQRTEEQFGNNRGTGLKSRSYVYSLFLPAPHGVSKSHWAEFAAFSKHRWLKALTLAGFSCIVARKGPVASGYGLGWDYARKILQGIGCTSEYIYIASKR